MREQSVDKNTMSLNPICIASMALIATLPTTVGAEVARRAQIDVDGDGQAEVASLQRGEGDLFAFTIDGNVLRTAETFDLSVQDTYSVRMRTTDSGGLWHEDVFTITVTDVNEAHTDLELDNASVAENEPAASAATV